MLIFREKFLNRPISPISLPQLRFLDFFWNYCWGLMHPFPFFCLHNIQGTRLTVMSTRALKLGNKFIQIRRLRLQRISEPLENWSVILRCFSFVGKNMKNAWQYDQYAWQPVCVVSWPGDDWWSLDFSAEATKLYASPCGSLYMRYDTCCTYDRNNYILHCFGWIGVGITQHHPQTKVAQHNPAQWDPMGLFQEFDGWWCWWIVKYCDHLSPLAQSFFCAEVEFPSHEDGRRSDQRRSAGVCCAKKALRCSLHRTRGMECGVPIPGDVKMWTLHDQILKQSVVPIIFGIDQVAGITQNLTRHPSPQLKRIAHPQLAAATMSTRGLELAQPSVCHTMAPWSQFQGSSSLIALPSIPMPSPPSGKKASDCCRSGLMGPGVEDFKRL